MSDEKTVASGFPDPDDVAGPTERLRTLHGEKDQRPEPPKYGRSRRGSAGRGDTVSLEDMVMGAGRAGRAGDAIEAFARRVGDEAAQRVQEELNQRGYLQRLQRAGAGAGQLAAAGVLGACAAGAATAGVVLLYRRVLPPWAAAFATAATLGGIAAPLAVSGQAQIRQGIAGEV